VVENSPITETEKRDRRLSLRTKENVRELKLQATLPRIVSQPWVHGDKVWRNAVWPPAVTYTENSEEKRGTRLNLGEGQSEHIVSVLMESAVALS
jgi:hypothetical protein